MPTSSSISFRNARPSDAAAFAAVHDARRTADKITDGLRFEYCPDEAQCREELANSTPPDWIVADQDEEVVGYGSAQHSWTERDGTHVYLHLGWVKPKARGSGIGRELLARLEARCKIKSNFDGATGRVEIGANASGTEESAQRLLRHAGYTPLYTMMEMQFPHTTAFPSQPFPAGYELRPALPEHYRAIWQFIGDAYYVHGAVKAGIEIATEDDYHWYFHSDSADPTLWFVAWEQSRIAGAVLCRLENGSAEIYEVSVGHAHRRKGLAKALLSLALAELRSRNVEAIRMVTKRENPSEAWRLYEAIGFETVKTFPRWRKQLA